MRTPDVGGGVARSKFGPFRGFGDHLAGIERRGIDRPDQGAGGAQAPELP